MKRSLGVFVVALMSACASPSHSEAILVSIDSQIAIPSHLDEIAVTVVASGRDGALCAPITRSLSLDDHTSLPLLIRIEVGSIYTAWSALRVVGLSASETVFVQEHVVLLPMAGERELHVELSPSCYRQTCGTGRHCLSGGCIDVPAPGVFDATASFATSCDTAF